MTATPLRRLAEALGVSEQLPHGTPLDAAALVMLEAVERLKRTEEEIREDERRRVTERALRLAQQIPGLIASLPDADEPPERVGSTP